MLKSKSSKFVVSLLAATQLLAPMAAFAEDMELLAEKPVVAEVKSNDVPNRVITPLKMIHQLQWPLTGSLLRSLMMLKY